ncbi:MAG TPA: hypothetical protein PK294_06450 [Ignavibacteria bacterium]|nr:hypothetical protein [Ignavibacteria bacterium]HQY52444.1 hypothetical protein [Ignavibacteria bacterium]HRB00058.1 hypothetical protein [Ignavibacteria bacterium]
MNFSFSAEYGFVYAAIMLIVAGAVSYFYYKKTILKEPQKKFLTALRALSVFFIFILLLSPVMSFISNISPSPKNIFLIDNSESLLIENRNNLLKKIVTDEIKGIGAGNSEDLYFLFSGDLIKEISADELNGITYEGINNFETDLSSPVSTLQEKLSAANISTVNIVSDGMINEGGNPLKFARSMNVPFNYYLTGDTIQKNDVSIKNLYYNKTAFAESTVPVKVQIASYNYNTNVNVSLYEEDKLIDTKTVAVNERDNLYDVSFNVFSAEDKIVKYRIESEPLENEITLKNNFREFFIKFTDNKFKVLVISGGPSADNAFITEELKQVRNFETTVLTQKSGGEFYEGGFPDINIFDTFILIGYPTAVSDQSILNRISAEIENKNSSLIFFAGRNTDYSKLMSIEDKLSFKISSSSDNEELTGLSSVISTDNEIFSSLDQLRSVSSMPDIFKTSSIFSSNPSADVFLLTTKNSIPALIIENTKSKKSAAFLAYGFYKWRLNKNNKGSDDLFRNILSNIIIAITDKEAQKHFSIETTKSVYSKYEDVKFNASILNHEVNGNEKILVKISGNGIDKETDLIRLNDNQYSGKINIPEDGNYEYTAGLYDDNVLVENILGRFSVGENNFEFSETRADNSVLKILSLETGGQNLTGKSKSEIDDILTEMNGKSEYEFKTARNLELNVNPYYLALLIFLLCLEWFLRKRNNLP